MKPPELFVVFLLELVLMGFTGGLAYRLGEYYGAKNEFSDSWDRKCKGTQQRAIVDTRATDHSRWIGSCDSNIPESLPTLKP